MGRERWDGMGISDLGIFGWEGERRDRGRGFWRNGRFFVIFLIISSRSPLHTHTHSCPLILANSPHLFFFWQAFTFSQKLQESQIKSLIQYTKPVQPPSLEVHNQKP